MNNVNQARRNSQKAGHLAGMNIGLANHEGRRPLVFTQALTPKTKPPELLTDAEVDALLAEEESA